MRPNNNRRPKNKSNIKVNKENCVFCKGKMEPGYKNYQEISRFVSDRGKIVSSSRSGICAKHQRKLSIAIKRARHLGLFQFAGSL